MVRQKSVLLLFLFDRYFDREMNLKKNGGKDNADYRCHDPSSFSLVTKLPNWQNVFFSKPAINVYFTGNQQNKGHFLTFRAIFLLFLLSCKA